MAIWKHLFFYGKLGKQAKARAVRLSSKLLAIPNHPRRDHAYTRFPWKHIRRFYRYFWIQGNDGRLTTGCSSLKSFKSNWLRLAPEKPAS
jgi:hypothetical protein